MTSPVPVGAFFVGDEFKDIDSEHFFCILSTKGRKKLKGLMSLNVKEVFCLRSESEIFDAVVIGKYDDVYDGIRFSVLLLEIVERNIIM